MDYKIEKDTIYNDNSNCIRKFYQKTISKQIKEMKTQVLYHRQFFERISKPYLRIFQNDLYDLMKDLNNPTNLKILKFMVEDQSVRLSENDLYDLLEELVFIQNPCRFTQDNIVEFETHIITILSILEYIVFNIETFHVEAGFYETISDQLESFVSYYRNYSSITSWAASLNHYIPTEEIIHQYNIEFLLEYLFNILKILNENELQFRKVNLQVDHFLKVLVKSFGINECAENKVPLEQSWERLLNSCDFGNLVSPFFTDYYILKRIKMIIQTWSREGDKIMISKYGKRLLMEFMWTHADNIWSEEIKYDRKNSSNDEILTQHQLKNIVSLFGILDLIENYIIESEHLSTLALVYHFAKESLQRTKSAPIQIKSTVILLKLYFRDGIFFKMIDQDFEYYFQDLNKEDIEAAAHFKTFLSAIKPRLYQEPIPNNTLFENLRGIILLSQIQSKRNDDKDNDSLDKSMIEMIASEMTCSVTLEPAERLCILGCEHVISFETFLNLSRISRYRCPQCREDIQDHECVFLPQHHIYSFFYLRFVACGSISTPPILTVKTTRPHYFSSPLLSFDSLTTPQVYYYHENIRSEDLPNKKPKLHNNSPRIRWPLKLSKKLHPAYNEALKALNNKHYEETVIWLTSLLQHYPNSYSTRYDRAFINSLLLRRYFSALEDLNIALSLKTKSPHAWNLRAETFRRIGYYDDALLDINQALRLAPNNTISYGIRGALFYKMKRFNESLKDLNYSLQQLPNDGFCLGFLGATLVKLGRNDDAFVNFNKALEMNPEDAFVLTKRAKLYHEFCLNDSGLIDINNTLSINPCNHKALVIRSEIHATLGNDFEALSNINKSLEMKPDNINALKIRARLYHKLNRNEEALNDLDEAYNLNSNDISILELRGEIHRSMCYFEEAIEDFNQILKVDPYNIFALSYRGATKYDQELYKEALIDLNKALELRQENNLFILKIRAKIFIALKRYHEALMDQNRILDNEPNNNAILLERREVYRKLGFNDKIHRNSAYRSRITLKPTYSC